VIVKEIDVTVDDDGRVNLIVFLLMLVKLNSEVSIKQDGDNPSNIESLLTSPIE